MSHICVQPFHLTPVWSAQAMNLANLFLFTQGDVLHYKCIEANVELVPSSPRVHLGFRYINNPPPMWKKHQTRKACAVSLQNGLLLTERTSDLWRLWADNKWSRDVWSQRGRWHFVKSSVYKVVLCLSAKADDMCINSNFINWNKEKDSPVLLFCSFEPLLIPGWGAETPQREAWGIKEQGRKDALLQNNCSCFLFNSNPHRHQFLITDNKTLKWRWCINNTDCFHLLAQISSFYILYFH